MKHYLTGLLFLLCSVAMAADIIPMRFRIPETGFIPSYISAEYNGGIRERHGGSTLGWSTYRASVPILDPFQSHVGNWMVSVSFEVAATVLDADGSLSPHQKDLYSLSLPISFIRPMERGRTLLCGMSPTLATDFCGVGRSWDVTVYARYTQKISENLSVSLGAGIAPRYAVYAVLPLVGLDWTINEHWQFDFSGVRAALYYTPTERFKIGPMVMMNGGAWMVSTEYGKRQFRLSGLLTGIAMEYDFHREGQRKRIIYAALGSTVLTRAQYCNRTGDKDAYRNHYYRPGAYAAVGVDFRF